MSLKVQCEEYLAEVRSIADKIGKRDNLEKQLEYLSKYACSDEDPEATHCHLYKDFAPLSFEFVILKRKRTRRHECRCGHEWTAPVQLSNRTPNLSGEATQWCPKCGEKPLCSDPVVETYERWFNGGCIFHGNHDGFGSGQGPTFSCCLNPTDGWSIHT